MLRPTSVLEREKHATMRAKLLPHLEALLREARRKGTVSPGQAALLMEDFVEQRRGGRGRP